MGGCHRLLPTNIAAQVDLFLLRMSNIGGYEDRIAQLDCEQGTPQSIRDWMAEWNRRTDAYPVWGYLPDWLEMQWAGSDLAAYGFAGWWASEYVPGEGPYRDLAKLVTETQWHIHDGVKPAILQFTSRASVPGVSGYCDVNIWPGTMAELRALATTRRG